MNKSLMSPTCGCLRARLRFGRRLLFTEIGYNQSSQGFFSRYMKKKAQGGAQPMETITEDPDEEEEDDDEMEEDEERAVEEALQEAEFMENVEAATVNT